MFEVDVVHVARVHEFPLTHEAFTPDGTMIAYECQNFGVEDLVEIGAERGVTRWAEHTADDGIDVPEEVVLIGWAESPIARDDVERSYHRDNRETRPPMVNIKVHNTDLPSGDAFAELLGEFKDDLDSKLAALPQDELRDLIERFIEKDDSGAIFAMACESNFEAAEDDAKSNYFPGYSVKVYAQGRSGGWLVVEGLPDIDAWDVKLLTTWSQFEASCKGLVADIPRAMAWHVLANRQDELAERVVRVELTLTLSDEDLDEMGDDPTEWDWQEMLDLNDDSNVTVRRLA